MTPILFEYRPTIKRIYWALIIISILALLIIFRINIVKWSTETYIGTVIKMVMTSLVPISIIIRLHFFIRPYIFSKYRLENNILKIKFKRKEKFINLDNVKKLSFTLFSPRFFGGCKIKTEAGDEVRFLSLLENNHKIVEYLATNRPDLKTDAKYKKYINTSRLVHLSWRRILRRLKKWPYLLIKFLVLPGAFVFYLNKAISFGNSVGFSAFERFISVILLYVIINFFVSFIYNYIEEFILNNKAELATDEEISNWDFEQEKIIAIATQVFCIMSSCVVLYFVTQIFIHLFKT